MSLSKHLANLAFGILIGAVLLAIPYVKDLRFEVITEDYFPRDEMALRDYNRYKELFGIHPERSVGILIFSTPSIYDSIFLSDLRKTVQAIESEPAVLEVRSLFDLRRPYKLLNGYIELPIIHPFTPEGYMRDSVEVVRSRLLTENFIGSDHESTLLAVRFQDTLSKAEISGALKTIRGILNTSDYQEQYLVGRPFLEDSLSQLMGRELRKLGVVLIGVMILMMVWIFRSIPTVLLTLGILVLSMGLAYGIFGFFGFRLEILSNILPVLIIVLSINNSLHIYKKGHFEYSVLPSGEAVADKVIREKYPDIILANLTTALGFGSLYFSALPAMEKFGLLSAIAICTTLIVNLICFTFLLHRPFFGNLLGNLPWTASAPSRLLATLHKGLLNRRLIGAALGGGLILVLIGVFQIDTNTKKLTNLPDVDQVKAGVIRYGDAFGGVTGFELMIGSSQQGQEYQNALSASDTLSKYLEKQGVSNIRSVAAVQDWMYREFGSVGKNAGKQASEKMRLYNDTAHTALIRGRMLDIGRTKRDEITRRMKPLLSSLAGDYQLDFRVTGEDYLNNLAHTYRIREMLLGLAVSVLLVSFVILAWFRSWFYFFISFLANILPLLLVAGFMGWFHLELRGSSSLLFTIGYAIAVDDTIHFLSAYRRNRTTGNGIPESIGKTLAQVGSPIFYSSLLLSTGFMVLLFSRMWDLFVFGMLIALFVMIAMICDLILLPVLLYYLKDSEDAQ